MKRIFTIVSSVFIMCLIPFSMLNAQEKKTEKKIKIVIADESGTKVVIDTLMKDCAMGDSISMKDGKHCKIYVISDDNDSGSKGDVQYRVISRSSKGDGDKDRFIYINEGKTSGKETDKTFNVYVNSDDKESAGEKTRYVIAKDGMVMTVEGSDEEKAKDLIKEIENKLGVKSEGVEKKNE